MAFLDSLHHFSSDFQANCTFQIMFTMQMHTLYFSACFEKKKRNQGLASNIFDSKALV